MRVHVIQTGRNVGNETFMRRPFWRTLLRRRKWYDFPVFSYVVEHPEGPIAIDTGLSPRVQISPFQHRVMSLPSPRVERGEEIDAQMRAEGLRPEEVRRVVLTHLDWDHTGGLPHFPDAEVLVHRPEYEYASTRMGKWRYQPKLWPSSFDPTLYDLDPEPYGPFPNSKALTDSGDVRLVPLPGHTIGQIGVVLHPDGRGKALLFSADHVLRQDWFVEDYAKGDPLGLAFFPEPARETSRRIRRFADETETVLLPAHDAQAPARLTAMEPLAF